MSAAWHSLIRSVCLIAEEAKSIKVKFVTLCNALRHSYLSPDPYRYHSAMTMTNSTGNASANATNTHQGRILVVDDDLRLRDLLRRYLAEQGFNVVTAENAQAMNKLWIRERYDLLVLDLMLPGEDGLSICRRLRGAGDETPIIMLTAKGEDVDRIVGLEMGADDYLPKPFNPRELVARINAVLRRKGPDEIPGAPSETPQTFQFGDFILDLGTRTLKKSGESISLTTGEFSVLKVFARHARQPLSREKLMELARGREYEVFDRSLDVQISRLRKLIEPDPSNPIYIQTVWGLGYVFIPEGQPR